MENNIHSLSRSAKLRFAQLYPGCRLKGRTLILESDNDSIIPASERVALKALYPQAQVHTFIGAGHGASIIKREEYISVIGTFLQA
jgi:pimeloyl-ACP methyl ester carboxylesterase